MPSIAHAHRFEVPAFIKRLEGERGAYYSHRLPSPNPDACVLTGPHRSIRPLFSLLPTPREASYTRYTATTNTGRRSCRLPAAQRRGTDAFSDYEATLRASPHAWIEIPRWFFSLDSSSIQSMDLLDGVLPGDNTPGYVACLDWTKNILFFSRSPSVFPAKDNRFPPYPVHITISLHRKDIHKPYLMGTYRARCTVLTGE
ncbi:hypothetical protein K438DRAFT_1991698 [Mycena galopus ATCC 62051]|nr:hypothetical protein K438DRAFT_1991698 [Mycena galopus ATCC 62051]